MSWVEHHKRSERLASEAQVALFKDRKADALKLYAQAADAEDKALADLDRSKVRTVGISAVSAASLHYKACDLERAGEVAAEWLRWPALPDFAKNQLRSLQQSIQKDQTPVPRVQDVTVAGRSGVNSMNEEEVEQLLTAYPRLYHMAERGAWEGIRQNGLLSTSALLDLYGVRGKARFALESARRDVIVPLQAPGLPVARLRDQCAMDDAGLKRCLQDGMTPQQWYECLNAKVFFWLTKERLDKLTNAQHYRDGEREVLELDSRRVVAAYRDAVWLCPMNSGATKPFAHPRGPTSFSRIDDYPYRKPVVELCVDGGIADVERFVERVYVVRGTRPIAELVS